jgi:hypothetical protein
MALQTMATSLQQVAQQMLPVLEQIRAAASAYGPWMVGGWLGGWALRAAETHLWTRARPLGGG